MAGPVDMGQLRIALFQIEQASVLEPEDYGTAAVWLFTSPSRMSWRVQRIRDGAA